MPHWQSHWAHLKRKVAKGGWFPLASGEFANSGKKRSDQSRDWRGVVLVFGL